jgi:hypothetical protein
MNSTSALTVAGARGLLAGTGIALEKSMAWGRAITYGTAGVVLVGRTVRGAGAHPWPQIPGDRGTMEHMGGADAMRTG